MTTATRPLPSSFVGITETKRYTVREIFHSLQGEGGRAGSVNVFLRFAGCNLQCTVPVEGFNCDTDFHHGTKMSAVEIARAVVNTDMTPGRCRWVIVTGGEPTLQFDRYVSDELQEFGYAIAIETNGTKEIRGDVQYVAVSPKPGNPCVLASAHECRIVLKNGQHPDADQMAMAARSHRRYVSPAFDAPAAQDIAGWHSSLKDFNRDNVAWCIEYVKNNPMYSLSLQMHKVLDVP